MSNAVKAKYEPGIWSLQQTQAAPPPAPPEAEPASAALLGDVASEKRPCTIDACLTEKQDAHIRNQLALLNARLSLPGADAPGLLRAALAQLRHGPRSDVAQALSSLLEASEGAYHLGGRDLVALALSAFKTDHFDHGRTELKAIAKILTKLEGPYSLVLAKVQARVQESFQNLERELRAADVARDVPMIASLPEDDAIEAMLFLGADDREEAASWLARAKGDPKDASLVREIAAALDARRDNAAVSRMRAVEAMKEDLRRPPDRALATLLLRYPALASEILVQLGVPSEGAFPPEAEHADFRGVVFREHAERTSAMSGLAESALWMVASSVPVMGLATSAAHAVVDLRSAYAAANDARVAASIGLIPRAEAERLDDAIVATLQCVALEATLALAGFGAASIALRRAGKTGISSALDLLMKSPATLQGLIGGIRGGLSREVQQRLQDGETTTAVLIIAGNALTSALAQAGLGKLAPKISALIARVRKAKLQGLPATEVARAVQKKGVDMLQTASGNGNYSAKILGHAANPTHPTNVPPKGFGKKNGPTRI